MLKMRGLRILTGVVRLGVMALMAHMERGGLLGMRPTIFFEAQEETLRRKLCTRRCLT